MIYTYDEKIKREAELHAKLDYLKDKLLQVKSEAKKETIKNKIDDIEAELDELYFTPTAEDLEETKYWI